MNYTQNTLKESVQRHNEIIEIGSLYQAKAVKKIQMRKMGVLSQAFWDLHWIMV